MPKWRNKIEVKKHLSADSSDNKVLEIVKAILPQLSRIVKRENRFLERGSILPESKRENVEYLVGELEEIVGHFEWVKTSIESKENPKNFSFDNWCEAFNNYLEQLYDLGDSTVRFKTHFDSEKFLWIG